MLMYFYFKCYSTENCFSEVLQEDMERLEEYAEESPATETGNLPRYPIPEDLNTNSSELLQTVKDLKT